MTETNPLDPDARTLRVTVAQLNPTVGALDTNTDLIIAAVEQGSLDDAHAVVTPELAVTGYPPEDLLLRTSFIEDTQAHLDKIAAASGRAVVMVGAPQRVSSRRNGDASVRHLTNAAHLCHNGHRSGLYEKQLLPDYGVFDETRWFLPGESGFADTRVIGDVTYGVLICEDLWTNNAADRSMAHGAQILFVLNASPYEMGKHHTRERLVVETADRCRVPVVYVNQVGGQDGILFDGRSLIAAPDVGVIWRAPAWRSHTETVEVRVDGPWGKAHAEPEDHLADVWEGITVGIHDYVVKNGFADVVIGLSGGIDSAVVAALAVDALGADRVRGIGMPGPYSSDGSVNDARRLAENLGIHFDVVPIGDMYHATFDTLHDGVLAGTEFGVAEENLQARLRGMVLMAVSNKHNLMVLNTSNKSESSVGYTTLYGDMTGGFAPLADCRKTLVYELAAWRNTQTQVIPIDTITKPPSAELAPGQRDDQSLPPYDTLDFILERYVEQDQSPSQITKELAGKIDVPAGTVERVCRLVDHAEYKRRQAAPGVKLTPRAFGRGDRRMPITNGYR